jgi:hypothetical protein
LQSGLPRGSQRGLQRGLQRGVFSHAGGGLPAAAALAWRRWRGVDVALARRRRDGGVAAAWRRWLGGDGRDFAATGFAATVL